MLPAVREPVYVTPIFWAFKQKKSYLMDLNEIINFFYRMIVYHPFISMGIAAALGILIYIKPKEILKVTFTLLVIAAVCYILYCLLGATESGYFQKTKMINNSKMINNY